MRGVVNVKTAKCLYCGEEFPYNDTKPRKHCSHTCAGYGHTKPVKITLEDGEVLRFRNANQAARELNYSLWAIYHWVKYCKNKKTEYISLEEYERESVNNA